MIQKTLRTLFVTVIWLMAMTILLAGCAQSLPASSQVFTPPAFSVALEVNADQETYGSLIVTNTGESLFPADDDFEGEMNLWDQTAAPRAKIEVPQVQEIQPGESLSLSSWTWHLEPGVYFLTWGSPKYGGSIAVFSVAQEAERLHLGKVRSFPTKPTHDPVTAEHAGSVRSFTLQDDGTLLLQGETPIPEQGCLFPLLIDQDGLLDDFPTGQCATITQGRWQFQIPMDPEGTQISIQPDTNYRVVLFSNDLTIPPSEPFDINISAPPTNE